LQELVKQARRSPFGRRYTPEMHALGYALNAISPQAYGFLRGFFPFPCPDTTRVHFLSDVGEIRIGLETCKNLPSRLEEWLEDQEPGVIRDVVLATDAANCTGTGFASASVTSGGVAAFMLLPLKDGVPGMLLLVESTANGRFGREESHLIASFPDYLREYNIRVVYVAPTAFMRK
jgi:hypothetical protein